MSARVEIKRTKGTFTMRLIAIASSLAALLFVALAFPLHEAQAVTASPFAPLIGRWSGIGMIGYKASLPEKIKCRATYLLTDTEDELKQTIRCATAGGAVEIVSNVKETAGKLTGHWKETIHNFEGDLTGDVTPKGFHVVIQGSDVAANMDIVVNNDKQAVEIQFTNSSLIGMTLVMTKG
ncbi:hypothetical protein [Hyphomicrobium sp. 2TAF46]|uniref:hypothetical protein n=1 Tax=Hyphomicrobium sp. 2TAF46 TaxID=3233019 RepID=UPI003F8F2C33